MWAEDATEHSESPAGAALPSTQSLDPHAYTPPHLVEKTLTSHAALQSERKQVTVLFCDLANSTGLAEQYEILAYHFTCGKEWAKALEYLLRAAEKVTEAFANREAIILYDQSLEAADHLGDAVEIKTLLRISKSTLYAYVRQTQPASRA